MDFYSWLNGLRDWMKSSHKLDVVPIQFERDLLEELRRDEPNRKAGDLNPMAKAEKRSFRHFGTKAHH